jgi:hypothetical protein
MELLSNHCLSPFIVRKRLRIFRRRWSCPVVTTAKRPLVTSIIIYEMITGRDSFYREGMDQMSFMGIVEDDFEL